jgi:Fe-S-cluster containining protein
MPPGEERCEEAALLKLFDAAFTEAVRRGGEHVKCRAGCASCCYRPFAITQADAARLRRGIEATGQRDITVRAQETWDRLRVDFPGDAGRGVLTGNEEWREWFFRRAEGSACPVLDEAEGRCRLYEWRPAACRLGGPLIQIGSYTQPVCELNYTGLTEAEREPMRVVIDPGPLEPPGEETIIAAALG